MTIINDCDPSVTTTDHDEDVSSLTTSVDDYYRNGLTADNDSLPPGLDGALRTIFEERGHLASQTKVMSYLAAAKLISKLELELVANVYRWTGHFPEATRHLAHHLAARAESLQLVYPAEREVAVVLALTTLVTSLAMNHLYRGSYLP